MTGLLLSDWAHQLPALARGLRVSLELTVLSLAIAVPGSVALAVLVSSGARAVRLVTLAIVELGRGMPVLVMLQLVYFGLPQVDVKLSSFVAAVATLAFIAAAYMSEIVRAGLEAVPAGQREAARAVGLRGRDELRFVVLPQAFRIALPPLLNFAIVLFQVTSLAFVIAVPELLSKAYALGSATFRQLDYLTLAGLVYAVIVLPAAMSVRALERRMARSLP
jgi:polar amino acid transport system permease protein